MIFVKRWKWKRIEAAKPQQLLNLDASMAEVLPRKLTGSKRKQKLLNKGEKAQVMLSVYDVDVDDVLSYVEEEDNNERHITENSAGKHILGHVLKVLASRW